MNDDLQHHLLAAHATNDLFRLATLYFTAGEQHEAQTDITPACFFYTQAYIYALDGGNAQVTEKAYARLKALGRER